MPARFLPIVFLLLLGHFWGPRDSLNYSVILCAFFPVWQAATKHYITSLHNRCSKHVITNIHAMPEKFWTRLILVFSAPGRIALVHTAATEAPFWTWQSCYCGFLSCVTQLLDSIQTWIKSLHQHREYGGKHWKLSTTHGKIGVRWKQILLSMIKWVMWYYCLCSQKSDSVFNLS